MGDRTMDISPDGYQAFKLLGPGTVLSRRFTDSVLRRAFATH